MFLIVKGVFMEGCILKVNMVNPGIKCPEAYTVGQIATANLEVINCFSIIV